MSNTTPAAISRSCTGRGTLSAAAQELSDTESEGEEFASTSSSEDE